MEIQNKLKHKKRRTRKNLDEMRKRSHNMTKGYSNSNYDNTKKDRGLLKCSKQYITADRLTLALFNKAVKSETVTRLIRSNQTNKKNSSSYKNDLKSTPNHIAIYEKLPSRENSRCLVKSTNNIGLQDCQTNIVSILEASSPDSNLSCSPTKKDTCNIHMSEQELLKTEARSNSYQSTDTDCDHSIYDEFMSNISTYVINNIPELTKEEVINKNIDYLQQSYMESCEQETETNILKCMDKKNIDSNSPYHSVETIIQNPMDYIQKTSSWQQVVKNIQTPTHSSSAHTSVSQHSFSSLNILSMESPEYIYFPHKLNQ